MSTPRRFFAAADFDFAAKTLIGHAGQGMIDIGLVLATVDKINDGDPRSWYDAWFVAAASSPPLRVGTCRSPSRTRATRCLATCCDPTPPARLGRPSW